MDRKKKLLNFLIINLTLALMPIADIFYLIPSTITSGGLYGIAIVLTHLFGLKDDSSIYVPIIAFLLNAPLFLYSFLYFSKEYFNKPFYATATLPLYMLLMGAFLKYINYSIVESNIFVATILGSLIPGVGIGIIMGLGGSTGGADTVAKIINRYYPKISLGLGVTLTNLALTLVSAIMFGIDRAIASVISIILTGWFIDVTLWYGFNKRAVDME